MNEAPIQSEVVTNLGNLPTLSELGEVNSNLTQVVSKRSVSETNTTTKDDNWTGGVIDFDFNTAQNQYICLNKSFLRCDVEVNTIDGGNPNGRQPTIADRFALAEGFMCNLLSNAFLYMGSKQVSGLTQFCGIANMLRYRLGKDQAWFDSIGGPCFYLDSSYASRQATIVSDPTNSFVGYADLGYAGVDTMEIANSGDGSSCTFSVGVPSAEDIFKIGDVLVYSNAGTIVYNQIIGIDSATVIQLQDQNTVTIAVAMTTTLMKRSRDSDLVAKQYDAKAKFQVLFVPPLGVFWTQKDLVMPSGQYRLSLFPKSDKISAFQYEVAGTIANPNVESKLTIKNLYLYLYTFTGKKPYSSGNWYMKNTELNIQSKTLTALNTSRQYNIPSSTFAIAVMVVDSQQGTINAQNVPPSVFKNRTGSSIDLKSLQLNYSNQQKPQQLYITKLDGDTQNMVQRYFDTQQNSNLELTGGESFNSFLERGAIYMTKFLRPNNDRAVSLQLQIELNGAETPANTQIICAAFYKNSVKIHVQNGSIIDVQQLAV